MKWAKPLKKAMTDYDNMMEENYKGLSFSLSLLSEKSGILIDGNTDMLQIMNILTDTRSLMEYNNSSK